MNLQEQELHYPLADRLPAFGARYDLREDIAWLRMPLPFALDHINLWLLRDRFEGRAGWTLVDCGADTPAIRECWSALIEAPPGTGGMDHLPLLRIVCTHMHPDHVGLAAMLARRFDCPLWMTVGEYALCRILAQPPGDEQDALVLAYYRSLGVPDPGPQSLRARRGSHAFHTLVPEMPRRFRRIRDGESIRIGPRDWRVITGCGHSPEHASLYSTGLAGQPTCPAPALGRQGTEVDRTASERTASERNASERNASDRNASDWNIAEGNTVEGNGPGDHPVLDPVLDPVLIAGDMVLPRISTNTAVWEIEPESNPVQWYLDSIARLRACDMQTLVLPSHGKPFTGLHRRIDQLCAHHAQRLHEVRQACSSRACSALDIVPIMFRRPLDDHQLGFALGEALGHLHALWYAGELSRQPDDAGVLRFAAVPGTRPLA